MNDENFEIIAMFFYKADPRGKKTETVTVHAIFAHP